MFKKLLIIITIIIGFCFTVYDGVNNQKKNIEHGNKGASIAILWELNHRE